MSVLNYPAVTAASHFGPPGLWERQSLHAWVEQTRWQHEWEQRRWEGQQRQQQQQQQHIPAPPAYYQRGLNSSHTHQGEGTNTHTALTATQLELYRQSTRLDAVAEFDHPSFARPPHRYAAPAPAPPSAAAPPAPPSLVVAMDVVTPSIPQMQQLAQKEYQQQQHDQQSHSVFYPPQQSSEDVTYDLIPNTSSVPPPLPIEKSAVPYADLAAKMVWEACKLGAQLQHQIHQRQHVAADPTPAFRQFVKQVLTATLVAPEDLVLALYFVASIPSTAVIPPAADGDRTNTIKAAPFKMFLGALMLANKTLQDNSYRNDVWSSVSGIPVKDVTQIEIFVLSALEFNVGVSDQDWSAWVAVVRKCASGTPVNCNSPSFGSEYVGLSERLDQLHHPSSAVSC